MSCHCMVQNCPFTSSEERVSPAPYLLTFFHMAACSSTAAAVGGGEMVPGAFGDDGEQGHSGSIELGR